MNIPVPLSMPPTANERALLDRVASAEIELERLRKQNAALREAMVALNGQRNVMANSLNWYGSAVQRPNDEANIHAAAKQFWDADVEFGRILQSALQSDVGARCFSPEQVRPLRDALAKILVYFTPEHLDKVSGADCGSSAKAAMEHAESLGL